MPAQLWFTHLAAFTCGGLVVYLTMSRSTRPRGDTMTAQNRDRSKLAVAVIGMAVILVVFGLQVRDANERDSDYREQQAAFQAQQKCLTDASVAVGKYLVDTLNTRVQANNNLDKAQERLTKAGAALSAANTEVVLVVAGGFDNPPTATREDLIRALAKFRDLSEKLNDAAGNYAKVKRETQDTLGETGTPSKPYDPPKVRCVP